MVTLLNEQRFASNARRDPVASMLPATLLMDSTHRPVVSIVIPCYNAQRWVAAAIESALGQTYPETEVIVVDDGSSDGSLDVIKRFDGGIRWFTGPNRGPCTARNIGMHASRGEWIQFLDADDLLHPAKLEVSLMCSESQPAVEFVWAPHMIIDEHYSLSGFDAKVPESVTLGGTLSSQDALLAQYAPAMAMFRRRFLARVGDWNESLTRWVDLEYHARIAAQMPQYASLSVPLYFYRQHGGERISNSNRNHSNIEKALESLKLTEAACESSAISPTLWKSCLWPCYLQLARSSALAGNKRMFLNLMKKTADLRGTRRFQLKRYAAAGCVRFFGIRLARSIIESTLRSRSSKARG